MLFIHESSFIPLKKNMKIQNNLGTYRETVTKSDKLLHINTNMEIIPKGFMSGVRC